MHYKCYGILRNVRIIDDYCALCTLPRTFHLWLAVNLTYCTPTVREAYVSHLPMDELRLLVRSMMERLFGLLSNERFASDMSAVTLVITTLRTSHAYTIQHLTQNSKSHVDTQMFESQNQPVSQPIHKRMNNQ